MARYRYVYLLTKTHLAAAESDLLFNLYFWVQRGAGL